MQNYVPIPGQQPPSAWILLYLKFMKELEVSKIKRNFHV